MKTATLMGLFISPLIVLSSTISAQAFCATLSYDGSFKQEQRRTENSRPGKLTDSDFNGVKQSSRSDTYCFTSSKSWFIEEPDISWPVGSNVTQDFRLKDGLISRNTSSYSVGSNTYRLHYRSRIEHAIGASFTDRTIAYTIKYDGYRCSIVNAEFNYAFINRITSNAGQFTGNRLLKMHNPNCTVVEK